MRATATFAIGTWDEAAFGDIPGGPTLIHALVTGAYQGALEGRTVVVYIMTYRDEARTDYTAIERIEGQLDGRAGGFALRHEGAFVGGVASATATVVPDSGTGDLRGLRGQARTEAASGGAATLTLDYDLT